MFYALRYLPHVSILKRKHIFTLGRFETYDEADAARERTPVAGLLEVVERQTREELAS